MSPRRRRIIALAVLPACFSGALGPMHQHFVGRPHENLFMTLYLCALCVPLGLAIRETFKLRKEGGCYRA